MTTIYFVRHGQTEWNIQGRFQGRGDSALTMLGIEQAKKLHKYMINTSIDQIYCSSSKRTIHTAELIRGDRNIPVIHADELQEMYFGEWEGKTLEEIKELTEEIYNQFWQKPHELTHFPGETFEEVRERAVTYVKKLIQMHTNKTLLIVSHGVTLKVLLNTFENQSLDKLFTQTMFPPTSITTLQIEGSKINIKGYGEVPHYTIDL